jgi:hypothetical protein
MVAVNRKSFSRFLILANEMADEHLSHPACSAFPSKNSFLFRLMLAIEVVPPGETVWRLG